MCLFLLGLEALFSFGHTAVHWSKDLDLVSERADETFTNIFVKNVFQ